MPDYHPLDVRYKGPSTAYRGSAHGKPKGQARAASQSRKKPATVQTPSSGPWSGKNTKATAPRPPVPAATSSLMGQFFGVFRSVRNIYLVFIVIVVIAMAFGTPMSRVNSINFQSEQMVTMP